MRVRVFNSVNPQAAQRGKQARKEAQEREALEKKKRQAEQKAAAATLRIKLAKEDADRAAAAARARAMKAAKMVALMQREVSATKRASPIAVRYPGHRRACI